MTFMMIDTYGVLVLLGAGFLAGAINAVAGGGKLLVLPALLAAGLSPWSANITASLVLWPGAAGAGWQYRHELRQVPRKYFLLLIPCYAGAIAGMIMLQHTSNAVFERLVPWLILVGVLLFALQPYLNKYLRKPLQARPHLSLILIAILLLGAAVYGGYFGAGFGFVLMALLAFTTLQSVYQFSAIKNLAGGGMELLGVLYFAFAGGIEWGVGTIAMLGCIAGGIYGARWALKLPQSFVRHIIILVGVFLAIVAFARVHLHL